MMPQLSVWDAVWWLAPALPAASTASASSVLPVGVKVSLSRVIVTWSARSGCFFTMSLTIWNCRPRLWSRSLATA